MKACSTCPSRLAADQLEGLAELFAELGAPEAAARHRARAAEIRTAGCTWWWSIEEEQEGTGQTRLRERCGREVLPHFLRSFGMDVARSANAVAANQGELEVALGRVLSALRPFRGLGELAVGLPAPLPPERLDGGAGRERRLSDGGSGAGGRALDHDQVRAVREPVDVAVRSEVGDASDLDALADGDGGDLGVEVDLDASDGDHAEGHELAAQDLGDLAPQLERADGAGDVAGGAGGRGRRRGRGLERDQDGGVGVLGRQGDRDDQESREKGDQGQSVAHGGVLS